MATLDSDRLRKKTRLPIREVKQKRSQRTLERILSAAEALLDTREFDDLSMADLAREAGCAVGTLYGRIPSKESLLVCLHERYVAGGLRSSAAMFEAVGDGVENWRPGDRVTLPFVCGCGACEQCCAGNQQICDRQTQPGFTHCSRIFLEQRRRRTHGSAWNHWRPREDSNLWPTA